jgi:integrase
MWLMKTLLTSRCVNQRGAGQCLNADSLTKKFVAARNLSGLAFEESPPTFHEIRSLSGRLYERERGKEFARKLMGHKSEKMTDKYLDTRGKEYSIV